MVKKNKTRSTRVRCNGLIGATAASLTTLHAGMALAQQNSAPLEEIVVTAQRRAEKLQDVPVAVKAFSARQIEDAGIASTQDFVNMTPNMSFDNSFTYANSFVVIRGVTQINNADSPVAVVVDGVPQNDQKQLKMNLVDVERIEVLKGPQGALYGRNAIGGALVIDTKKPKNKLEGFVKADVGAGNLRDLSGGFSGALVPDQVMFRVVGQTKSADGVISNTFLNKKVDYIDHDNTVRAKVTVLATDDVALDFRLSTQDFRAGATWDSLIANGNPNNITDITSNILGRTTGKTDDFTFKADINIGIGTLTAITGYTKLKEKYVGDLDFTNIGDPLGGIIAPGVQLGQGQERTVRTLSQEFRIASPGNLPLRWIGGLYYLDSKRDMEQHLFGDVTGSVDQYDSAPKIFPTLDRHTGKASAIFGQIDYDIASSMTVSAALRYDRDARTRTDLLTGASVAKTFDAWQPKMTLSRRLGGDSLAYGTVSTGFRSGGFNSTTATVPMFRSETLRNYEVGYKGMLLDRRMTFNVAGFYSQSKDFQYFYTTSIGGNLTQLIGNIDKVDIKGVDVDFRFAPVRGLEFDGGLGITNSRIKENVSAPATVGNWTPKASPWKLTLGMQYTAPVGNGVLGFGRFDMEERSKKYWHADNSQVSDGLTLLGMRLGVRDEKEKWSVNVYGKNLTDKKYYADVNGYVANGWPNAAIGAIGSLAPRRTVGVEANFKL